MEIKIPKRFLEKAIHEAIKRAFSQGFSFDPPVMRRAASEVLTITRNELEPDTPTIVGSRDA